MTTEPEKHIIDRSIAFRNNWELFVFPKEEKKEQLIFSSARKLFGAFWSATSVILCLMNPQPSLGQFEGQWADLPKVKGTTAFVTTRAAETRQFVRHKKSSMVSETYTGEKAHFVNELKPSDLGSISFSKTELSWDHQFELPSALVFKDLSTHNIRYMDMAHGLPSNNVTALAQDNQGLIYIGTSRGLIKFNGSEMLVYDGPPSFPLKGIRSLFYDSYERLWIATEKGIAYLTNNHLFVPHRPVFGTTHLKGFNENTDTGEVLIFTIYNGLFILQDGRFKQYKEHLPTPHVSSALRSGDGRLWFAFGNSGFGYLRNDSLFMYERPGVFNTARSLYEFNDEIWIGIFAGKLMKHRSDSLFQVNLGSDAQRIYSIDHNDKGLWLTDYERGVHLIKSNGEMTLFDESQGLSGTRAFSLLTDDYDNIWIGDTYRGLSRIDENIFHKSDKPLDMGRVTDIEFDDQGRTWYFRDGGFLIHESDDRYVEYTSNGQHAEDGLISGDVIWMSNAESGLTKLDQTGFTSYQIKEIGELDSTIYAIQMDDQGGIWGWDYGNRLHYFREGEFYNFSSFPAWEKFEFFEVLKSRSGIVFALTKAHGVVAIRNKKYLHLSRANGLATNTISRVFEDELGTLWFCMDGGIQMIDRRGNQKQLTIPELRGNPITDVLQNGPAEIFATTSNGVLIASVSQDDFQYRFYGKEYGLNMIGNSMIRKDADGNILIGGSENLIVYNPYFLKDRDRKPQLSLSRVTLDQRIVTDPSHLEADQEMPITFIFNNIYWGGHSKLIYKLNHGSREGQWNEMSSNSISFEELSYGEYELSVYASAEGMRSEPLQFAFGVLPHWYQTNWARLIFITIGITVIIGYFLYRERNAKIVKRQLQHLVDEKTEQLQVEKNEVTRQLAQKELLMQEVHHRVKNNLTFLKSLLYLRASASEDKDVKLVLDECQARIHSMSLVHQNLYEMEDMSQVDFDAFLRELFSELELMFEHDRSHVSIEVESNDLKMDMKLSIFLGLILNEMITNSFKYAFPDGQSGLIRVLAVDKGQSLELNYADSGAGLPEGLDISNSSGFGFKLINILVAQLNGQISYVKNELSTFIISIPRE